MMRFVTKNAKSLQIATWNAQSIRNKRAELEDFLIHHKIDIVLVQETFLKIGDQFTIPNYNIYRNDRMNGPGGGTAIITKKTIKFTHLPTPNTQHLEATTGTIILANAKIQITSLYRPPHKPLTTQDLDAIFNTNLPHIAAGDLNSKHRNWNSTYSDENGKKLLQYTINKQINIHGPTEHTHYATNGSSNVIDICLTKNYTGNITLQTLHELPSDHLPVQINIGNNPPEEDHITKSLINWPHFRFLMQESTLTIKQIQSTEELESAITNLTDEIHQAEERAKITITTPAYTDTRFPHHIKLLIREKNRLLRRARETGDPNIKRDANRKTQQIKNELKLYYREDWQKTIEATAQDNNKIYKICRKLKIKEETKTPPLIENDTTYSTEEEKASIFADTMEAQFQLNKTNNNNQIWEAHVDMEVSRRLHNDTEDPIRNTNIKEVTEIIKQTNKKKAPGPDKITNNHLKNLQKRQLEAITNIANAVLKLRTFPNQWKTAHIVMIPKPDKPKTNPNSYRPISLLSLLGKVVEKIILRRLQDDIEDKNAIPDIQFGFRHSHSATLQITRLTDQIIDAFNRKHHTGLILLDIEKAFDRVWHSGLIFKMLNANINKNIVQLTRSFLQGRHFKIKIEDTLSPLKSIAAGVPQGSPISPVLYNIYTADIPQTPQTKIALYADDTAIFATAKYIHLVVRNLKTHMQQLTDWYDKWKIKLNTNKTQIINISRKRDRPATPFTINNSEIEWRNDVKYLGITIDHKLTWKKHIERTRNKALKTFIKLYPLFAEDSRLNYKNKLTIYKLYILPIIMYGATAWGHAAETHLQQLQRLQNKILRRCTNAPWFIRNTSIARDLDMPTIAEQINQLKEKLIRHTDNHPNLLVSREFSYENRNNEKYKKTKTKRHIP